MYINMKIKIIFAGISSLAQQDIKEDVESFAGDKLEDKMEDLLSRWTFISRPINLFYGTTYILHCLLRFSSAYHISIDNLHSSLPSTLLIYFGILYPIPISYNYYESHESNMYSNYIFRDQDMFNLFIRINFKNYYELW